MTKILQQAFDQAQQLDQEEQEALGRWLLEELASQRRWDELLARSQPQLSRLAEEALAEHRAGRTRPLDPDRL